MSVVLGATLANGVVGDTDSDADGWLMSCRGVRSTAPSFPSRKAEPRVQPRQNKIRG
jgi:hypothetical protein